MFPVDRLGGKCVDSITIGYALHLAGVLLRVSSFLWKFLHGCKMKKRYLSNEFHDSLLFFLAYICILRTENHNQQTNQQNS